MSAANKLIAKLLNGCHLEKRNDTYVFKCEYPVSWALSVATGSMSNILKGLRKITPSVVGSVIVKHKLIPLPATNRIHAYLCVIPPLKKGGYWYVVVSSWALNKEGVEQVPGMYVLVATGSSGGALAAPRCLASVFWLLPGVRVLVVWFPLHRCRGFIPVGGVRGNHVPATPTSAVPLRMGTPNNKNPP